MDYLISADGESMDEPYCKAIGSLMYTMVGTPLYLAVAAGLFSKFVEKPCPKHWQTVKSVFIFGIGTKDAAQAFGDMSISFFSQILLDDEWAEDVE